MYCKFVLNNWHFFGDIFSPFFNNAFNRSSSLSVWDLFDGVNSKRGLNGLLSLLSLAASLPIMT